MLVYLISNFLHYKHLEAGFYKAEQFDSFNYQEDPPASTITFQIV